MKNFYRGILTIICYFAYQQLLSPFLLKWFRLLMPAFYKSNPDLVAIIVELIFVVFLIILYHKDFGKYFKTFKAKDLGIGFKYWGIGFGLMIFSNYFINFVLNKGISGNETGVRTALNVMPLYMIFSVCIFAPIVEELVFRGAIRDIFKNKIIFVIISGFAFGAVHLIAGFNSWSDFIYIIPYGSLGACLALAYTDTNNLLTSMAMHCFHNTLVVSMLGLLSILPSLVG